MMIIFPPKAITTFSNMATRFPNIGYDMKELKNNI